MERIAAMYRAVSEAKMLNLPPVFDKTVNWKRDGKAAPFKRNDRMLEMMPIGVVVFRGSGITDNLADKAKRLGVPVQDCRGGA